MELHRLCSLPLFFLFLVSSLSGNGYSQEEPSDALLVAGRIKASLLGDSENLLLSTWNLSRPLCSWRGLRWSFADGSAVNCDDASSSLRTNLSLARDPRLRLLSLQLPAAGLSGDIPREIGELSALQSLYLGVNSLSGTVPLELGNSPSLADVDLRDNSLSGSLPPSIWNLCGRLVSLRLGGNNFTGAVPEPAVPNSSCADLHLLDLGATTCKVGSRSSSPTSTSSRSSTSPTITYPVPSPMGYPSY